MSHGNYGKLSLNELKLALMERMNDEKEVIYLHNIALPDESVRSMPLYEIDRQTDIDHLTSLFIPYDSFQDD